MNTQLIEINSKIIKEIEYLINKLSLIPRELDRVTTYNEIKALLMEMKSNIDIMLGDTY